MSDLGKQQKATAEPSRKRKSDSLLKDLDKLVEYKRRGEITKGEFERAKKNGDEINNDATRKPVRWVLPV